MGVNNKNMNKEVNLEQILRSFLTTEAILANNPDYTYNMVLSAMREACKQTLELAAENAESYCVCERDMLTGDSEVDKQSILDTINQIK